MRRIAGIAGALHMAAPRALTDLPQDLLGLIAAAGRDHAFCALRRTCRELALLSFDDYAAAAIARVGGSPARLPLLKKLLRFAARTRRWAVLDTMIAAGGARGVVVACVRENVGAALQQYPAVFAEFKVLALESAARFGRLEMLQAMLSAGGPAAGTLDRASLPEKLPNLAAFHGHLAVCEYLHEVCGAAMVDHEFANNAVAGGCLALLEFVAKSPAGAAALARVGRNALEVAGAAGRVAVFEWLECHGARNVIAKKREKIAIAAIRNDHVAVLEYLERFDNSVAVDTFGVDVMFSTAVDMGACGALAFLAARHPLAAEKRAHLAKWAAAGGRVRALDWLVGQGLNEDDFCLDALRMAAKNGRRDVLEWARQQFGYPRAVFAQHAGCHEATDAFLASFCPA